MEISVNGTRHELPDGANVNDALDVLGIAIKGIAVERNLEIVPKAQYASTVLQEGDRLEIVTLVGGG